MFRLQNNVPEVYPDESRDFQLFCRVYDCIFHSTRYSIDSLQCSTNTLECNSSLLELLKTKLGLFSITRVGDKELRYILTAFPYIMRYKGSRRAINYIVRLYSRLADVNITYTLDNEDYSVNVSVPISYKTSDTILLTELLKFVLPTGYLVKISTVETSTDTTVVKFNDAVKFDFIHDYNIEDQSQDFSNSLIVQEDNISTKTDVVKNQDQLTTNFTRSTIGHTDVSNEISNEERQEK